MIRRFLYNYLGQHAYMQVEAWRQRREYTRNHYREHESLFLSRFVNRGDVCLDIGANLGSYSYYLSKIVSDSGKVFAFEPVSQTYKGLVSNLTKTKSTNVFAYNLGISDGEENATIFVPKMVGLPSHGRAHLSSPTVDEIGECVEVRLTTVDKFHDEQGLGRINFIKMDIEGAELSALKGAMQVLNQYKPVLLLEIEEQHTRNYDYIPQDIFRMLNSLGYRYAHYVNKSDLIRLEIDILIKGALSFNDLLDKLVGRKVNNFFVTI